MAKHPSVPENILARLRLTCLDLPEAREEEAWLGTRWVVAKKNFAHVLVLSAGKPTAYARAAQAEAGCVLTFRLPPAALVAPRLARPPFFRPPWFQNIVGLKLGAETDWNDVSELVTQSFRLLAPKKLVILLDGA